MIEREKAEQAVEILKEKGMDLWLIFARETRVNPDPSLEYLLRSSLTWQSAIMVFSDGDRIAIVGELDRQEVERSGIFTKVIPYRGSLKEVLLSVLDEKNPSSIGLNYSLDDPTSDGLTHGMYLLLQEHLEGTRFIHRLTSAQKIVQALRSRKTPSELERIKRAIEETEKMFDRLTKVLRPGLKEKEVAELFVGWMEELGAEPAWDPSSCPAVFAGPQEVGAHASPTDKAIKEGELLNIDFGIKLDGYCSDLQRMWYFLRKGETAPPPEVIKAFDTIKTAIQISAEELKPGKKGWEIDKIARDYIVSQGYDEYPHALGHQVGRDAHDGAALLAPTWERYGSLPYIPVEEGMVFTLEPRVNLPEYGVMSLEEMVIIGRDGAEFLSHPQKDLWVIGQG